MDNDINDDVVFEGLPENQNKLIESEEEKESDDIFVHENDELQKSNNPNINKTLIYPKSRLRIEDKNYAESNQKKKKLERTSLKNEFEVVNMEDIDFINNEQGIINNSIRRGGYLDLDQILNLEDPFLRMSRPTGFNYKRISAFEQKFRNSQREKRKDFLFNEKPKSKKKGNKQTIETILLDNRTENDDITDNSGKTDIKEKGENIDENDLYEESGPGFIDVYRPSALSRDGIELEENTFEFEVMNSVGMTVLQVINCMIKVNLVQIAISMKELGLILGPITICLIALMSLISLNLILEVNKKSGQRSYLIFSEMVFGHVGSVIILICQFMSAFGGCLSYIVIFNKVVPNLFTFTISNKFLSNDKIFTVVLGVLLFFFCYKQDVNIIKSAAKYAVFAVLLFFGVTILDFIVAVTSQSRLISINSEWNKEKKDEILYGLNNSEKYSLNERISNIISAVACIILSYSFHIFTFSIYGVMGKISRKQFFITTSVSVFITTIIYLICGTIGYLLYYDTLKDSILDAIQETWLSSLLSLANVINVIMTFPITFSAVKNYFILFVGIVITLIRNGCLWLFKCFPRINRIRGRNRVTIKNVDKPGLFKQDTYLMSGKHLVHINGVFEFLLTILIYFIVFLFASLYNKLKVIFSFTGGVMGNILSFIFPSIFYLGIVRENVFSKYGIVAIFFIIFGFVTMGICIASTIQTLSS